jgi:hypothetical protein
VVTLFTTRPSNAKAQLATEPGSRIAQTEVSRALAEYEAQLPQEMPPAPTYQDHPVDTALQTGASALLGGAMSISAPYHQDDATDPAD